MRARGQLVLLAAVALVIALVPMALAHLQLGYQADMQAATVDDQPVAESERVLRRAVDDAAAPIPSQYDWGERRDAVAAVRNRLDATRATLNTSRLDRTTAIGVSYAQQRARQWATTSCPRGQHRQFGSCVADRGVVVQERLGETHVVAVAFDVTVTSARGTTRTITVVGINGR
jgi:hypothetical protein